MRVFLLNLDDQICVNYYNFGAQNETGSVIAKFGLDEQEGPKLQELDYLLAPKPKLIITDFPPRLSHSTNKLVEV